MLQVMMSKPKKNLATSEGKKPSASPHQKESARMAVASGLTYREAARIVGIAENEVMNALREVPDDTFREMIRTMSRALLVRSYCVGMSVLDELSKRDLRDTSPASLARIASTVVSMANDKLAPTSDVADAVRPGPVSAEDAQELLESIRVKVMELKVDRPSRDRVPLEMADASVVETHPPGER